MNDTIVAITGSFIGATIGALIFLGLISVIEFVESSLDNQEKR